MPRKHGGGTRALVELLGGTLGAVIAGGLSYGVTLAMLGPIDACDDCNPRPDGAETHLLVLGLSYALIAPPLIAGGVTLAGDTAGRDGRYDLAFAGAAAGLGGAFLFGAFTAAISDGDPRYTRTMLTLTMAILPVAFSILFYETLSPYPDRRGASHARSWQPLLGVAPDGRGGFVGARGAF